MLFRSSPAKNLATLLDATAALRSQRQDFILCLAGEGECREELMRRANELGLSEFVEFPGRLPGRDVQNLLARSVFAVVSSTHETFSVWAAEALMCGRPVLSTRCGGPEEFVTPEVGRLVSADDVDAMAEGLAWMLDHFSEFEAELLSIYATERFAPEVVARRIIDAYSAAVPT